MTGPSLTGSLLSEAEEKLKERFDKSKADRTRVPSTARGSDSSERIDQLVLPDELRAKMPMTKDKFLVKENPHLVQWERETRKFLRNLTPRSGHRVAAVMIYEWATGISIASLMAEGGSAQADLRKINDVLEWYFASYQTNRQGQATGKPYSTYIAGRKVAKTWRVPPGYYIRRHRPFTLTLYAEYFEGSLYP